MNILNQFVTQLATFIGDTPSATRVAWVVTIVLILFALFLLRWVFNWFTRANEIVANQEHIIELLESRSVPSAAARQQSSVTPNLNMRTVASMPQELKPTASTPAASMPSVAVPGAGVPAAAVPVRQHPIDDEFSEILNVRPHNMQGQSAYQQRPVPQVVTPLPATQQPVPTASGLRPPTLTNTVQAPGAVQSPGMAAPAEGQVTETVAAPPIQPQPTNTSVTMLGTPEARAERQLEAREAMRLAEKAANSTLSKTADIPDIPTALVRTYASSKTNPLTGKRVGDRSQPGDDDQDSIPNQFQLR